MDPNWAYKHFDSLPLSSSHCTWTLLCCVILVLFVKPGPRVFVCDTLTLLSTCYSLCVSAWWHGLCGAMRLWIIFCGSCLPACEWACVCVNECYLVVFKYFGIQLNEINFISFKTNIFFLCFFFVLFSTFSFARKTRLTLSNDTEFKQSFFPQCVPVDCSPGVATIDISNANYLVELFLKARVLKMNLYHLKNTLWRPLG